MPNTLWRFIDDDATFVAGNPDKVSRLYFPLVNEFGMMSSITPKLHGDIKTGQHSFLTAPVTAEDLNNTLYNRNFWLYVEGRGAWSVAFGEVDETLVEAGFLWHKVIKINKKLGVKVEVLNFVPAENEAVELMLAEVTNISKKKLRITPTLAIPIYGRSADNLRDHRHVTSLLNRIRLTEYGVVVTPTMSFDERGHKVNNLSYFVLGCQGNSDLPKGAFPTILEFSGEAGNLERPEAVLKNISPDKKSNIARQGKEAIGAIRFRTLSLGSGKSMSYIAVMGISEDSPEKIFKKFDSVEKINKALSVNKKFWVEKSKKVYFSTGDKDFDRWMKWVGVQPVFRKIFGCSFLPDFDYGRGGRGWRDLWQDSLTLLLINPEEARDCLINSFGGVRVDGSNATIIGKKQGEFIADRNNISRTWMDHGVWPFMALNLYINQSGDEDILFEKARFFESDKVDTVLEHILLQHKRPFTKIGKHGNFLLEGADWNDGLDMAKENGESAAFTAAYAGNLFDLANLLEKINYKREIIDELRQKANGLAGRMRKDEWVKINSGYSFFNGYYDNLSQRVEGDHKNGVRMTLAGQVFPIMSGVASQDQINEIYRSAKKYLWDPELKGFRLNTDFKEVQPNLGRAFGFAYGEKENGAFFSHMNVMFAYAFYKRGFAKEGFEVINSIYDMCLNTSAARIYPGIPEYFNADGRGMYDYLTGSASWLLFTMLTQVFGVRGEMGDLVIEPKLVKRQFGKSGKVSVNTGFAGKRISVNYYNPDELDYGEYKIGNISINGNSITGIPIKRELFIKLASRPTNSIDVNIVQA
ncbi:MAG: cellobiose phosphorylase [Candidatus Omnitrophica bacterium]|nr:cellobiose phosphorylase [Candidatus Omnitrophota bacterium]